MLCEASKISIFKSLSFQFSQMFSEDHPLIIKLSESVESKILKVREFCVCIIQKPHSAGKSCRIFTWDHTGTLSFLLLLSRSATPWRTDGQTSWSHPSVSPGRLKGCQHVAGSPPSLMYPAATHTLFGLAFWYIDIMALNNFKLYYDIWNKYSIDY